VFLLLLGGKVASKIFGMYPVVAKFRQDRNERWFYTLLMSTGLTFGTISAIYGLTNGIVSREQYSFLVAVVIASAVVPTLVAMLAFLPRHLMPPPPTETAAPQTADVCVPDPRADGLADE
jgi:Kef-type K+ transport system membrane component KefB